MEPDVHDDTSRGLFSGTSPLGERGRGWRSWHEVEHLNLGFLPLRFTSRYSGSRNRDLVRIVVSPFGLVGPAGDSAFCG